MNLQAITYVSVHFIPPSLYLSLFLSLSLSLSLSLPWIRTIATQSATIFDSPVYMYLDKRVFAEIQFDHFSSV